MRKKERTDFIHVFIATKINILIKKTSNIPKFVNKNKIKLNANIP